LTSKTLRPLPPSRTSCANDLKSTARFAFASAAHRAARSFSRPPRHSSMPNGNSPPRTATRSRRSKCLPTAGRSSFTAFMKEPASPTHGSAHYCAKPHAMICPRSTKPVRTRFSTKSRACWWTSTVISSRPRARPPAATATTPRRQAPTGKSCNTTLSPDIRSTRACAISPARWCVLAWNPAPS